MPATTAGVRREEPRSAIFSSPLSLYSRLHGFRSRCMVCLSCMAARPVSSWRTRHLISLAAKHAFTHSSWMRSYRLWPQYSSCMTKKAPLTRCSNAACSDTTLGWSGNACNARSSRRALSPMPVCAAWPPLNPLAPGFCIFRATASPVARAFPLKTVPNVPDPTRCTSSKAPPAVRRAVGLSPSSRSYTVRPARRRCPRFSATKTSRSDRTAWVRSSPMPPPACPPARLPACLPAGPRPRVLLGRPPGDGGPARGRRPGRPPRRRRGPAKF